MAKRDSYLEALLQDQERFAKVLNQLEADVGGTLKQNARAIWFGFHKRAGFGLVWFGFYPLRTLTSSASAPAARPPLFTSHHTLDLTLD